MEDWLDISGKPVKKAQAFGIMGILNLAPDSFYDQGKYRKEPLHRIAAMLKQGADVIDLGAESTRPGAREVESELEIARLEPVLEKGKKLFPDAIFSLDTRHAQTALYGLEHGIAIVNDVSAFGKDAEMLEVLAQYKPGYVLMHCQGEPATMQASPHYGNVTKEVMAFFESRLETLTKAGLPENRVVLDPGIGFGKNLAHNLELMRNASEFLKFGRPLLAGISMKSFFGTLLGLGREQRQEATAVTSAILTLKGVSWHRVHEPASIRDALKLAAALA